MTRLRFAVSYLYGYRTAEDPHELYVHVRIRRQDRPHLSPLSYYSRKDCEH